MIKNLNESNFVSIIGNKCITDITFYKNESGVTKDTLANNVLSNILELQFTDVANYDYALHHNTATEYMGIGAPGGPEFFSYQDPATVPKQIHIMPNLVIDSVIGGSIETPLFLFDEQELNVAHNQHAISNAWKPDVDMTESAYHAIVNLGIKYNITGIDLHDMANNYNFTVSYLDSTLSWSPLFVEPCNSYNTWKKHTTNISTRYLRFSMYENVSTEINEIIMFGYPAVNEVKQIVIQPSMVIDLVSGGSINSPLLLFDEQNIDVVSNSHPNSASWKPDYTDANAPYYVKIDLGQDYNISEINLHDVNDTNKFLIQYGDGTNWVHLIDEPCDAFNVWKSHKTNIITRYLRLVMPSSPYAGITEIIVMGYPIQTQIATKTFIT